MNQLQQGASQTWWGNVGPHFLTNSDRPARSKMKYPGLCRVYHVWSALRSLASLWCIIFLLYTLLKGERARENGPNLLMADLVGGSVGMCSVAWQARLGSVLVDRMELWLALHCMMGRAGWSTSRPGRTECWWLAGQSVGRPGQQELSCTLLRWQTGQDMPKFYRADKDPSLGGPG